MVETATTVEYTHAELRSMINDAARARIGIDGEELLRRYRAGDLDPEWDVSDLLILADLLDASDREAG